ncbi:plasma membrane-associated cation-binding protein 1-like [Quillaja saponaria]|uniref:Plasma membrane-associated cation-binding protein 1-like n=1 Tax=Quillaja saponaria TaxID=32244 RepID=A0AAD7M5F8_QUISA|nr:plasma membrane-associated cation-binding protein 1-like [Quillaja saponaria]
MGYWKNVIPKIKKVFEKNGTKKAAAAEASKSFDDSKDEYNKEFEEKKAELQPKVVEIYEASSAVIKSLVKEPSEAGLKKNSTQVRKFIEELVKIEFPGSKPLSEASTKFGPDLVSGPVFFVFEKVSTFIVVEEKEKEKEEDKVEPSPSETKIEETSGAVEKEIVVEQVIKEEVAIVADEPPSKAEEHPPAAAAADETPAAPPAKVEEEKPADAKVDQPTAAEPPKP